MRINQQDSGTLSIILEIIGSPLAWVIVGGAILLWRVSKWHSGIEHRIEKTETRLSGLETLTTGLSNKLDRIGEDIKEIFKRLPGEPLERVTSPISLTDHGKNLSQKINAPKIAEMQIDKAVHAVKGFNAYQIQEYCFSLSREELLQELKENHIDLYNKIHEVAYDEGIDVEKLTRVIALELRDKVLSSLNKLHTEIDQYSPD